MPELQERNKDRALRLAATAVQEYDESGIEHQVAVRLAAAAGASLDEIAEATGLPHATVERLWRKSPPASGGYFLET